ncbi:MAG: type I-C CRISPR-associated protein Cas8c/Csd1 [Acidobacteria bacterium]|nr:type I-C CRISPR-associated protein Cas8c/Csd1 [Acidobacteriota bacterium]
MILQALCRLTEQEDLLGDPDYEWKRVAYLIRVGDGGRFLGIQTTKQAPPGASQRAPKPVAKRFQMPREPARTSGDRAFFLHDKAEYSLGLDPETDPKKRRAPKKVAARFGLFRDRLRECRDATGDPGVAAALALLEDIAAGAITIPLPAECAGNDLFAFTYSPDDGGLLTDRPAVRRYWKDQRREDLADAGFLCLVTGENAGEPGNHPQLKVPGGMSSGVPLVSFNNAAFESQGWKGNENAPVSRLAAEAYTTAIRRLLDPAPPDPHHEGQTLPRRNLSLSRDTTVCFWAERPGSYLADVLAPLLEANPDQVVALYHSLWQGRRPALSPEDAGAFYALVLTGAQGRVVLRSWFETTVPEAAERLARYFGDLAIVRNTPPPKDRPRPPAIPLRHLLEALAPQGKSENIPAHLAAQVFAAALEGTAFPISLLQRALTRARAEVTADSWADLVRRDARAALIKGVLIRSFRKEISPVLDPENTEPGYRLGRLMAVLERLQQLALGDVNATIVDRYFAAASATPRVVFSRLLKGARHHASKAKGEPAKRGRTLHLERLIDAICEGFEVRVNGFPAHLSLEQQGLFVLGYHQQRHELWRSKTNRDDEPSEDPPTAHGADA